MYFAQTGLSQSRNIIEDQRAQLPKARNRAKAVQFDGCPSAPFVLAQSNPCSTAQLEHHTQWETRFLSSCTLFPV